MVQERYITVSTHKKNVDEARTFFDRVIGDVTSRLNKLDSHSEELDAIERLRILHDFSRSWAGRQGGLPRVLYVTFSQRLLQRVKKLHSGALFPVSTDSILILCRDGIIFVKSTEMVDSYNII